MSRILLLAALCCGSLGLLATDYYVAKTGDDANDGSEAAPFLTIEKAAAIMVAGDVCIIKAGTYREILSPANAGTAAAPITFRAFGEDEVIISATEPVTGWQVHAGPGHKASVEMTLGRQNMLYLNGEPMDHARWPNNTDGDPFTIDAMTVEGGTAGSILATQLPTGLDITDGHVWYLGAHSGASWTRAITSVSGTTINHAPNDIERWPFNPHNPTIFRNGNRGRFYLFGAEDLIDTGREWYFDDATNEVTFQAPTGIDPNTATVEYAARTHTVFVEKAFVTIEGINTFGGIVELKADNITLRTGEIRHGYQALDEPGNTDAQVSEGSVWVRGSNIVIEDNLIEGGSMNGISVQGWGGVSDVLIEGNEILEFNTVGNHSSPIRCRAPRSKIINNTIIGGGRDGIFIPSNDSEIAWNDVSDVMRINNDGGLFYVVGNTDDKNTEIHHNWFHDSEGPDYADGRCAGIYLDNDSKGYDVHHNVVWNISWSGVQMNWDAWNNDIFNNTLWKVGGAMAVWLNGRTQINNRIWNNYADSGEWVGQDIADNQISATDPFRDLNNLDFKPADDSGLIDGGREIPGITDGFAGSAPDIGAYERGIPTWIPGAPRANPGVTTALPTFIAPALPAQIAPNPATAVSYVSFNLKRGGDFIWQLIATDGRVLRTGRTNLSAGEQRLRLDLIGLPSGTYAFAALATDGHIRKMVVVK